MQPINHHLASFHFTEYRYAIVVSLHLSAAGVGKQIARVGGMEANLCNNVVVEMALLQGSIVRIRIAAIIINAKRLAVGLAGDVGNVLDIVGPRAVGKLQAVAFHGAERFCGERGGDECNCQSESLHFD
jgi:hypothetical protein